MVTTADLSNESTTNSGTGFVSFLNAIGLPKGMSGFPSMIEAKSQN
jgi:hypothetical protein